jgi:hypothetical protein
MNPNLKLNKNEPKIIIANKLKIFILLILLGLLAFLLIGLNLRIILQKL